MLKVILISFSPNNSLPTLHVISVTLATSWSVLQTGCDENYQLWRHTNWLGLNVTFLLKQGFESFSG